MSGSKYWQTESRADTVRPIFDVRTSWRNAWILDRNDQKPGNDIVDNGSEKPGKGRFALRFHKAIERLPNRGSEGCNVCDKKGIDHFAKAVDKTSKGPARHITSPKERPGDGKPLDDFGKHPRIGTWKVGE